jgi:FkbM family methyltransferase
MTLSRLVKSTLHRVGLDVRLVRNVAGAAKKDWAEKWGQQWLFLQNYDIRTIVDVGANTGQFARMIRRVCPEAQIYCFEPIRECFLELDRDLGGTPTLRAFNLALGESEGEAEILRNAFTPCSSMLEPTTRLEQEYPETARRQKETVAMARLDTVLKDLSLEPQVLIKIDVEGYEPQVIRGAEESLARALFASIEIHFHEYYKGQPLFDQIYRMMTARDFVYRGSAGQYASAVDHRPSYMDAIFENARLGDDKLVSRGA